MFHRIRWAYQVLRGEAFVTEWTRMGEKSNFEHNVTHPDFSQAEGAVLQGALDWEKQHGHYPAPGDRITVGDYPRDGFSS